MVFYAQDFSTSSACISIVVYVLALLCHLRSIAAHTDHSVRRLSVCMSGSHFLGSHA